MFSAVLSTLDIRRERALGHAEGVAHHPDDARMRAAVRHQHRRRISRRSRSADWIKVKNPKHPSIERVKEAFS